MWERFSYFERTYQNLGHLIAVISRFLLEVWTKCRDSERDGRDSDEVCRDSNVMGRDSKVNGRVSRGRGRDSHETWLIAHIAYMRRGASSRRSWRFGRKGAGSFYLVPFKRD